MCVVIVKRLGLKHLCEGVQGQGCNSVEHWVWFVADAGLTPLCGKGFLHHRLSNSVCTVPVCSGM